MTFSFLLAFVIIRKRKFIFYGVAFTCCGLILLEKYLWQIEYITNVPNLVKVFTPLSFAIPICLYTISTKSLKNKMKWIFLAIPVIPYINFLPLYTACIEYKTCYILYEINDALPADCQNVFEFAPTFISDDILDILLILEFGLMPFLLKFDKGKISTDSPLKPKLFLEVRTILFL